MDTNQKQFRTICFIDISGYTNLTHDNPAKASNYAERLNSRVNEVMRIYGGRIIKKLGDGVMIEYDDIGHAIHACNSLNIRWNKDETDHKIHIGVAFGEISIKPDGDVEGDIVNLASRLCSAAKSGQIFISDRIKSELTDRIFTFKEEGDTELKGVGRYPLISVEVNADNVELKRIANDFIEGFIEARNAILPNLTNYNAWDDKERGGDQQIDADDVAWEIFSKIASKHNMLCISEKDNPKESEDILKYKYFLLMDPVDGSVNAVHNLPFAANFAFGRIKRSDFLIRDIEVVLVIDYLNQKRFSWFVGESPTIIPPQIDGKPGKPLVHHGKPTVFEAPDAESYAIEGSNGATRQRNLTRILRKVFDKKVQRRAIDCSGIRLLEIADHHLLGYGDIRGVTRPWDTIPSIRLLMEVVDITLLDMNGKSYLGNDWIVKTIEHRLTWNKSLGDTIIALHAHDKQRFLDLAQESFSTKWKQYTKCRTHNATNKDTQ